MARTSARSALEAKRRPLDTSMAPVIDLRGSAAVATGLLYVEDTGDDVEDFHILQNTVDEPLNGLAFEDRCPGAEALKELQKQFR